MGDLDYYDDCTFLTYNFTLTTYSNSMSPNLDADFLYTDSNCTTCASIVNYATNNFGPGYVAGNCLYTDCGRSDARYKKAISTLTNSLEKLLKISVKEYDWDVDSPDFKYWSKQDKVHDIGVIAQELMEFYPQVVFQRGDGFYGVHYEKLNAVLIEAVKEQNDMISIIKDKINLLKSKL